MYNSDGTPVSYQLREREMIGEELVVRGGQQGYEALNQMAILICLDHEKNAEYCKLYRDPMLLGSHTCEYLVHAWREFNECPRQFGHVGFLVAAFCFDGAIYDKMKKLILGWIALMFDVDFMKVIAPSICRE